MSTVRITVRWIITASLLLGLSMASVYPRDGWAVAFAANQAQKVCCCGTEDGRCCGMACCQMPNSKEGKAPASPNRSEVRCQPLGSIVAAGSTLSGQGAARFRHLPFRDSATTGSPSLIVLHIRLNA